MSQFSTCAFYSSCLNVNSRLFAKEKCKDKDIWNLWPSLRSGLMQRPIPTSAGFSQFQAIPEICCCITLLQEFDLNKACVRRESLVAMLKHGITSVKWTFVLRVCLHPNGKCRNVIFVTVWLKPFSQKRKDMMKSVDLSMVACTWQHGVSLYLPWSHFQLYCHQYIQPLYELGFYTNR